MALHETQTLTQAIEGAVNELTNAEAEKRYADYLVRFASNPRGYHSVKMSSYQNNVQYTNPRMWIDDKRLEAMTFHLWLAVNRVRIE